MKTIRARSLAIALALVAVAGITFAQDKYRQGAAAGPYRVVLSKPVVGLSYTSGDLYREHEYLGAMLNELDAKGLVPMFTNVLTEPGEDQQRVERLLVVCKRR